MLHSKPGVRRWIVRSAGLTALSLAASLVVGGGCKKKEEEVQYPPPQPLPEAGPAPTVETPPPEPTAAPDAAPPPLDTLTQQGLEAAIQTRAKSEAKFMKPVQPFFGANLAQGGQIEQTIQVEPSKCYTVIAQGGSGVTEVDVQLVGKPIVPIPAMTGPVLAVDNNKGSSASINPCWKNAFPMGFPASVVVKVTGGTGAVGAIIYAK